MKIWIFPSCLSRLCNYLKEKVWCPLKRRIRETAHSRYTGKKELSPHAVVLTPPSAAAGALCLAYLFAEGGPHRWPGEPRPVLAG